MAKKSNPRLTNSSTSGDASKMLEQRRNMTPEQRESEMNKVVNKVSGKKKSKGPLGSRKRLSGPRNKSQENRDRSRVIPPSESWPQGGNINAEGTFIPNDPIRVETTPNIKDSGYQTPNYESYGMDDSTANTNPPEPMAYKKSSVTYKLPGEGSRGAIYKVGGFNANSRAMQAGLIVDGGFGDLSADKAGSTPALFGDFSGMGGAQLTQVKGGGDAPGGTTNISVNPVSGGGNDDEEEDEHQMLNQKSSDYDAGPESEFEGMAVPKLQ